MHHHSSRFVVLFRRFAILLCALLAVTPLASAGEQVGVMMQIRTNFQPFDRGCELLDFVAAPTPAEFATFCAIGGPFGNGVVGVVNGEPRRRTGTAVHLDRTVVVNADDSFVLRTIFVINGEALVESGGVYSLSGSWEITGGTGAFAGMRGGGTLFNIIPYDTSLPFPPEYAVEQYEGRVRQP